MIKLILVLFFIDAALSFKFLISITYAFPRAIPSAAFEATITLSFTAPLNGFIHTTNEVFASHQFPF